MTTSVTVLLTIYGDTKRAHEAARQVENYAESLPGVAVKIHSDNKYKKVA